MAQTPSELRRFFYSFPEAAELLGIGPDAVQALVDAGHLKTTSIGRRRLIGRTTLERFERDNEGAALLPDGIRGAAS